MNIVEFRKFYGNFNSRNVSFSEGVTLSDTFDQFRSASGKELQVEEVEKIRSQYLTKSAGWGCETTTEEGIKLLAAGGKRGRAIDIGSGSGRAVPFLLGNDDGGVNEVVAVDIPVNEEMFYRCNRIPEGVKYRVEWLGGPMEAIHITPNSTRIVNADYSIPFCRPAFFKRVMRELLLSLEPGGVFCGTFFGPQDGYDNLPNHHMTIIPSTEALVSVFHAHGFVVRFFKEEFEANGSHTAGPKNWHIYHIVAQKPS